MTSAPMKSSSVKAAASMEPSAEARLSARGITPGHTTLIEAAECPRMT